MPAADSTDAIQYPLTGDSGLLQSMSRFYESRNTRSYNFRRTQLQKLKTVLLKHEQQLYDALYADLKKNPEESWVTEIGFVVAEINDALKNLKLWMQAEKVRTNLLNFPSSSYVLHEPLGIVLIIAPWNYPLQLLFTPLVGAIAAGNCVVLKPSEFAPASAEVMRKIIQETFSQEYILYVEGDGAILITEMMNNFVFDHVFYTGSTTVGKIIYQMAAKNLVPVTLELGGKSPCVVESDADIKTAARRIALTKFSNAGQMCVTPDYVLAHASVKEELTAQLKKYIPALFSDNPAGSYDYCKIINEKQFNRLVGYLSQGNILHGGNYDASKLYIEPTIMENVFLDAPLMQDEIFGPILPVLSFNTKDEALQIINEHKNPLAFYVFTKSKKNERFWLRHVAFGGGCVNNASWHLTNYNLPFGGRGASGIGNYHGKYSF
ncbi:MAG TPA: aldehyde dehydrogenase family protein, partial [Chitinophagaceae bacterium]|nr:aldehyde dehydrogenase family protein [Chitinophagaceae bacterium]